MPVDRTILRNRKGVSKLESDQIIAGYIALEEVYRLVDVAQVELEQSTGKPICIASCGKCCEGNTPVVTGLEAAYVLSNMSLLPSYHDLRAKALEWMAEKQGAGDTREAARHSRCAFLNTNDQTCMIYESRPLECRTYGVTRSAEPACPRPLHYTEKDDKRMIVAPSTPLGARINQKFFALIQALKEVRPELTVRGLLPVFIGKEMVTKPKLDALRSQGQISVAKSVIRSEA